MSEQQIKLPHALKEAELEKFEIGETAFVQPSALHADFNEDLWINSGATARGKSNPDFCARISTEKRQEPESKPNLGQGDRVAKVDLSGCSDDKKFVKVESNSVDYRQYPPMPQYYQPSPRPSLLPVVRIDGVDGKRLF